MNAEAIHKLADLAPAPAQERTPNGHGRGNSNAGAYGHKALEDEIEILRRADNGGRNTQLFKSSAALFGLVAGGVLDEYEVDRELKSAARDIGLPHSEITSTIQSGRRRGMLNPRYAPENNSAKTPLVSAERKGDVPTSPITSEALKSEMISDILPAAAAQNSDVEAMLRASPLTDAGNAECLAALYGDEFRFDHVRKVWMVWTDSLWATDDKGAADRAALEVVRARQRACMGLQDVDRKKHALSSLIGAENSTRRKGMLQTAGILLPFTTTVSEYDRDDWLAATPQGTLDLRSGGLYAARRTDLLTMRLGAGYDPTAKAPRWERFLDEVFGGDKELIAFIQRAVGYSLTGDTREQCMFLGQGNGANGKSVFLEVLGYLLGDYGGSSAFSTFDADRRSEASNDLASLRGKRLVTIVEVDEDRRLAESRVKAVTGQDPITCRFLYGQFFTYTPTFKLWMAVNHRPIIRGTDLGIWRRIRLIPFTENFEGKADKQLAKKLKGEISGILNWALVGLHEWRTNGLGTASVVEKATAEYRRESDLFGQWFEDCCASAPREVTTASAAYESFRKWCQTFGFRETTQTSFGRSMEERGYSRGKEDGKRVYAGFRLLPPQVTDY